MRGHKAELLVYCVLVLGSLLAASRWFIGSEKAFLTRNANVKGQNLTRYLASIVGDHLAMGQYDLAQRVVTGAKQIDKDVEYVLALNLDGTAYASTDPALRRLRLNRDEFESSALKAADLLLRPGRTSGVFEVVIPMTSSLAPIGVLRVGFSTEPVASMVRRTWIAIAVLACVILAFAFLTTSLRAKTRALGEANERLKDLDRAKSEFISVISHELRTPMTSINGFLATILRRGDVVTEKKRQEYLGIMQLETTRMIGLVNNLLDLTKLELGHYNVDKRAHDLTAIVETVVRTMAVHVPSVRLVTEGCERPVRAILDPGKIEQVLSNLVANAMKYSPPGEKVTISVATEGSTVTVAVKDRGPGIPPEHRDKLFTKFYRVETASTAARPGPDGTGLGLAIAKGVVEKHGGRIWVESEMGGGAAFYFTLERELRGERPARGRA
jgi:signal transduction histidine kinase